MVGEHLRERVQQVLGVAVRNDGPDELPRARPLLAIRDEDAVPQELFPFLMERLALSKVRKLTGQQGLDVGWVRCQDNPV